MSVLLFGADGQVGRELRSTMTALGNVTALTRSSGVLCGDLLDPGGIERTIRALAPGVIVNAAAYTAVDRAEREPSIARAVNAHAPGVMARCARECGALLVHYSTDYVFDGSGTRSWRETDVPAPLNVYGATKLEGENAIRASGCRHLILRTSWVFAARGRNFPAAILERARTQRELTVIDDQFGAPTGADLLASVTARAAATVLRQSGQSLDGTYHVAAAGETSWFDYARFVVARARHQGYRLSVQHIRPIQSSQFKTDATRPRNSRLDTTRLQATFDIQLPRWEPGVERALDAMMSAGRGNAE